MTCGRCGAAVADAYLCNGCTAALVVVLESTADLFAELADTTGRLTAIPQAPGTSPGCAHDGDCGCGVALPWDDYASRAAAHLRVELASWCRTLLAETYGEDMTCQHHASEWSRRPHCAEQATIRTAIRAAANDRGAWLATHMPTIRLREWAPHLADTITRHTDAGWRAVDRPEDCLYAGPCGGTIDGGTCERRLWATPEQSAIRCKGCGNTVIVADRQAVMLTAAAGLLMPAAQIATALTLMLRRRVSAATIRSWAHRGILERRDIPRTGSPTYRVGDVLDLIRRGEPTEPEKASAAS